MPVLYRSTGGRAPLRATRLAAALAMLLAAPLPAPAQPDDATDDAPRTGAARDAAALPEVVVTGQSATATTEGTGSYTTGRTAAATRLPLSLRETPQSVTVVTRQRMDDQRLDSVQDVLGNTTGISVRVLDSDRVNFYSRGFSIDSFQYDGIPTNFLEGASFLDTAFYDRIEVVRGATGLLTGAGNPSASVNLVRKRPQRTFSLTASLGAGSWDAYRGMADVSAPLTADGSVRARLVGVQEDRSSYLDLYRQKKGALYGILEADLTPDTTASVGYDYQDITPKGSPWGGAPLWFSDGTPTHWSRSKTIAADWSHLDNRLQTAFANLEHRFGNDWRLRAAFNQQRTYTDGRLFTLNGFPDRATGLGMRPAAIGSDTGARQNSLDALASGPFDLMGRQHDLVLGFMGSRRVSDTDATRFIYPDAPVGSYYDWTGRYPEPDFGAMPYSRTHTRIRQRGFYGAARFSLADPLKLIVGGRSSFYEIDQKAARTPFHYRKSGEFTPYAGLVYDFDDTYSAYASYTEIFNPQTYRDRDNRVIEPTSGKNVEAGVKAEYLDGRVNASAAVFEARLDNVAQIDVGHLLPDGGQAYYGASGTRSRGIDLDLQGEPAPGWNLYAGLSHFTAFDGNGQRLSTPLPRTTARLFTTWRLPDEWNRLTLGGGVSWQSRTYLAATSPSGPALAEQAPYALTSLMARYRFSDRADLALNVDNLFDKRYTLQKGFYNKVLYGTPRQAMLTLSYKL